MLCCIIQSAGFGNKDDSWIEFCGSKMLSDWSTSTLNQLGLDWVPFKPIIQFSILKKDVMTGTCAPQKPKQAVQFSLFFHLF